MRAGSLPVSIRKVFDLLSDGGPGIEQRPIVFASVFLFMKIILETGAELD